MTNNRSVLLISAIALILLALVPAVSALDVIYDEELFEYVDTTKSGNQTFTPSSWVKHSSFGFDVITFNDITKAQLLDFLVFEVPANCGHWLNLTKIEEGRYDFTYTFNDKDRPGVLYLNRKTDSSGIVTSTQFTIALKDWDIGDLRGRQSVQIPFYIFYQHADNYGEVRTGWVGTETNAYLESTKVSASYIIPDVRTIKITEKTGVMWIHHIKVAEDFTFYHIDINGFIDGYRYTSEVALKKAGEIYSKVTNPGEELHRSVLKTEIDLIEIISPSGTEYAYPLYESGTPPDPGDPDDPDESGITVYIKNSQTGALIANANVALDALVDGEYYPVTNRTEPSGIFSITLQPTGGGQPNPDSYRLIVTADGYNNPMPEITFTLGNYRKYFECFLDPIDILDPSESGITVYIKNSQTGALIANANVALDALVDGEYYPVTNRTEPSGIFTITLQPTGGGKPNPDGYRLIVTADGYNNPMPEIIFTLGDYIKYFECFLDPIAGGPVNENKTFIDFFVRDMSSNPISGATVKFGKYTLITNSAGYTVFEVDKNNNYSWTVSKSGYGPLTGNAVIGNDPRHTINTVLAPIVTPTTTTPIPTSPPIGPTPTMTGPSGEPVSNWLEWFAAHFGMILGGGVEIGKIFMWLCFTVPVGVYVGKEAKAGAAGFMAGAGIVTLFFVLIGWVPIWLVVLLALIIGLLYAKVFNSQDNGGGR